MAAGRTVERSQVTFRRRRLERSMSLAGLAVIAFSASTAAHGETVAERVHRELMTGRDVVVASYVALWYENQNDPAHNLYWGDLYGHSSMFARRAELRSRLPFLLLNEYKTTIEKRLSRDPILVKVFDVAVPATVRKSAVVDPAVPPVTGKLTVVTLAYTDMERAAHDMGMHLKTGAVPASLTSDAVLGPLLSRAYVIGYWGHNVYYGGYDGDDLETVRRTVADLPRGVFVVGCQSAKWFPQKFLVDGIEPLLFTTTNMAPEAYVAAALYDGLARGLTSEQIRHSAARAYAVYQRLARPPRSLFVNTRSAIGEKMQPIPVVERSR